MKHIPSNFEIFMSEPMLWVGIFTIICPLLPIILPPIIGIFVAKREDPENANFKAVWEANFSFVHKLADRIKSSKESKRLADKYPAVNKFVHLGYKVTKFDTVIAIDERNYKWVCVNVLNMPVLSFSDIIESEIVEDKELTRVIIYTKNEFVPEININVYDRIVAESLIKTVNNMRASVQNNLYK